MALLNFLARRALVGVLGAVDSQVFWEILAQLLDESRYRPQNLPFNQEALPVVFGDIYQRLMQLKLGEIVSLGELAALRSRLSGNDGSETAPPSFGFRDVWIRRGAVFSGVPSSSTARQFMHMREESPPWFLTLVPDDLQP